MPEEPKVRLTDLMHEIEQIGRELRGKQAADSWPVQLGEFAEEFETALSTLSKNSNELLHVVDLSKGMLVSLQRLAEESAWESPSEIIDYIDRDVSWMFHRWPSYAEVAKDVSNALVDLPEWWEQAEEAIKRYKEDLREVSEDW